jgi:hypothetical protein
MKEEAPKSLMELFAIAASLTERSLSYRSRSIVESYTRIYLPNTEKADYLLNYAHYLKEYLEASQYNHKVILERTQNICFELSDELASKERMIVLLHLIDIMVIDDKISPEEENLIELVTSEFNISTAETKDLVRLVFFKAKSVVPDLNFVFVEDSSDLENDDLEGSWIEKHKPKEK